MKFPIAPYIYIFSLLFASTCSAYRFNKVDLPSKIIAVLLCCAFINESAAFFLARKYHNNLHLYTVYSLLEFFLICLYFNYVIDIFKNRNVGILVGIAGLVLGIINSAYIQQRPNSINSYFLLFEALMVIGMSLFAFFRMLLKNDSLNLYKYHHFWLISILLFFWNITFFTWGLYNYINAELKQSVGKINTALMIIGTITYACFGCVFLLYPKMRRVS
jgi:hypothetical protein